MSNGGVKSKKKDEDRRESDGSFFYIEVLPIAEFKTFRLHDVVEKDGIERVAGQRADGSWETVKWLIAKDLAHLDENDGRLIADHRNATEIFERFAAAPQHIAGNRFEAKNKK